MKLPKKVKKSRIFFTMIPEPVGNHVMILGPDGNKGNQSLMYFSHRGIISKIMGKIQLLQKKVGFSTRKLFLFFLLKNWKNGILHNFAVKFLNEDKGYRWWSLQEWKDLSKVISKHPQLLSVGFPKCDLQLLELKVYWEKIMNFLP